MTTQPEALRLAGALLEPVVLDKHAMQAAAELRRLHAECEELRADRDSWERQCSDRVDDAVEFLRQRDEARAECQALRADAAKSERRAIMFADCLHQQIIAMRAAVVAWKRDGADAGMSWIANTLEGPGNLPTSDEIDLGAQALFDREMAEAEAFRATHPGPSIDAARAAKEQSK